MAHKISLPEAILRLVREGKLPKAFRTKDICEHLNGEFTLKYLKTVLPNYCEGTGNYIKRGHPAWFRRISAGLYEAI